MNAVELLGRSISDFGRALRFRGRVTPPIYVLTCFEFAAGGDRDGDPIVNRRTWGWFTSRDEAERAVLGNHGDMFEAGHYHHAVVEAFDPGALSMSRGEWWFRAEYAGHDGGAPTVSRCEKPEVVAQVCHFGMG